MSIYVLESEFGCIHAPTPAGAEWWGYLNPDTAVSEYEAADLPAKIDSIAAQAVAWPVEAGKTAMHADVVARHWVG
jgi:hypothetical protein